MWWDDSRINKVHHHVRRMGLWGNLLFWGLVLWLLCAVFGDANRAWRAVLINFLYFTSLATGMVVAPAMVLAARGEHWLNDRLRRPALLSVGFAPVCFGALFVLWLGRGWWAGWLHEEHLPNAAWLNSWFLFTRNTAALILLWGLATRYATDTRPQPGKGLAAWLSLTFACVLTLLGFDFVMALDPHWYSTLFGGYFFITAMYMGVNGWTFAVLQLDPPVAAPFRKDLGKLIVAFSLLSTYMMFCQLIPIWYESLPQEVRFVIPRLRLAPWKYVSLVFIPTIYLGPLVLLLSNRLKGSFFYMRFMTLMLLIGMWFERWWEVTPSLGGRMVIGLPEISMTAAFLALFVFSRGLGARLILIPEDTPTESAAGSADTGSACHSSECGTVTTDCVDAPLAEEASHG